MRINNACRHFLKTSSNFNLRININSGKVYSIFLGHTYFYQRFQAVPRTLPQGQECDFKVVILNVIGILCIFMLLHTSTGYIGKRQSYRYDNAENVVFFGLSFYLSFFKYSYRVTEKVGEQNPIPDSEK